MGQTQGVGRENESSQGHLQVLACTTLDDGGGIYWDKKHLGRSRPRHKIKSSGLDALSLIGPFPTQVKMPRRHLGPCVCSSRREWGSHWAMCLGEEEADWVGQHGSHDASSLFFPRLGQLRLRILTWVTVLGSTCDSVLTGPLTYHQFVFSRAPVYTNPNHWSGVIQLFPQDS